MRWGFEYRMYWLFRVAYFGWWAMCIGWSEASVRYKGVCLLCEYFRVDLRGRVSNRDLWYIGNKDLCVVRFDLRELQCQRARELLIMSGWLLFICGERHVEMPKGRMSDWLLFRCRFIEMLFMQGKLREVQQWVRLQWMLDWVLYEQWVVCRSVSERVVWQWAYLLGLQWNVLGVQWARCYWLHGMQGGIYFKWGPLHWSRRSCRECCQYWKNGNCVGNFRSCLAISLIKHSKWYFWFNR